MVKDKEVVINNMKLVTFKEGTSYIDIDQCDDWITYFELEQLKEIKTWVDQAIYNEEQENTRVSKAVEGGNPDGES